MKNECHRCCTEVIFNTGFERKWRNWSFFSTEKYRLTVFQALLFICVFVSLMDDLSATRASSEKLTLASLVLYLSPWTAFIFLLQKKLKLFTKLYKKIYMIPNMEEFLFPNNIKILLTVLIIFALACILLHQSIGGLRILAVLKGLTTLIKIILIIHLIREIYSNLTYVFPFTRYERCKLNPFFKESIFYPL